MLISLTVGTDVLGGPQNIKFMITFSGRAMHTPHWVYRVAEYNLQHSRSEYFTFAKQIFHREAISSDFVGFHCDFWLRQKSLLIPLMLIFKHVIEHAIVFVSRFCNLAFLDSTEYCAALFLCVRAFRVLALAYVVVKLAEGFL